MDLRSDLRSELLIGSQIGSQFGSLPSGSLQSGSLPDRLKHRRRGYLSKRVQERGLSHTLAHTRAPAHRNRTAAAMARALLGTSLRAALRARAPSMQHPVSRYVVRVLGNTHGVVVSPEQEVRRPRRSLALTRAENWQTCRLRLPFRLRCLPGREGSPA